MWFSKKNSSEIGNGWEPAVLDTKEEYDFVKESQRSFNNSVPYWIGGSANATAKTLIDYTDYIGNNSGNYHNDLIWMYLT